MRAAVCALLLFLATGASSLTCTDAALGVSASVLRSCSIVARDGAVELQKSCAVKVAYRVGSVSDVRLVRERPDCTIALGAARDGSACGARIERGSTELTINF